jgi:hypothetical protein
MATTIVKQVAGDPIVTELTGDLNIGDETAAIAVATNWPSGSGAVFCVRVVSEDGLAHEKIAVTRSGLNLTIIARGFDETTEQGFQSGATIHCCADAASYQAMLDLLNGEDEDPLSQYLTPERHAEETHAIGDALLEPDVVTVVGTEPVLGSDPAPARADHGHVLGAEVAGAGLVLNEDNQLEVEVDDVTIATTEDGLAVKENSIGQGHLTDDSVGPGELKADAVTEDAYADESIPGAAFQDNGIPLRALDPTMPLGLVVVPVTRPSDTGSISTLADVSGMTTASYTPGADRYLTVSVDLIVAFTAADDGQPTGSVRLQIIEGASSVLKSVICPVGTDGATTHEVSTKVTYKPTAAAHTWKVKVEPLDNVDSLLVKAGSQITVRDEGGAA